MGNEDRLEELEKLLQVTFHDRMLLKRAITHHSCCPETAIQDSYDTLEFLGDAFISVDIANLRTFNARSRDSLCADVLESVVGAIHIDQGPEASRDFIARVILPVIPIINQHALETNPKGRLQKLVLHRSGSLPRYRVIEQGGRNNDRTFTVGVYEQDLLLGLGTASSIKEAGRLAAREALEILKAQEME